MGILRSREQHISVTCAILKDPEREKFFAEIRKKINNRLDRVGQICGVSESLVSNWAQGKTSMPYHMLQCLVQELAIDMPSVAELRRESQPVPPSAPAPLSRRSVSLPPSQQERSPAKQPRTPRPPRKKFPGPKSKSALIPRAQPLAQETVPSKPRFKKKRPLPGPKDAPQTAKTADSGLPKLSTSLAYWAGTLLGAARYDKDMISFAANRRIGQNFAGFWARLTEEIFGVKPTLSLSTDHKVQLATLPAQSLEKFLSQLGFNPDFTPEHALGAPRWVWSNPEWKKAFLKGVIDVSSHFHRTPSINLLGLSQPLAQSVWKMLTSLGLTPKKDAPGNLSLQGSQEVQKYFEAVGTQNRKLADQFHARRKNRIVRDKDRAAR